MDNPAVPESTEMLPCPFCGSRAIGPRENTVLHHWIVECINVFCCAKVNSHSEEAVVKAWNRRIPAASPVAGVSATELLSAAIVDIAIAAGITKGELPMTGPEVLTLAKEIEHFVAQPSAEGDGWIAGMPELVEAAREIDQISLMICSPQAWLNEPERKRIAKAILQLRAALAPFATLPAPVAKEGRES